ncbi:MAG TPA: gamma-glutamyltransferase family protein [Caulobacteraceae bacterium]|nr:gamma-glutamyltransferase family protein [Caulobacteraceae bacterium]
MRPAAAAVLALCLALTPAVRAQPTPPTQQAATAPHAMVAAANPLAVEAGVAVLKRGGSAIDAAIAVQAVLGLVEPQSSGLGGGAFMVYYDARTRQVTAYNGRETAPAGATPQFFLGDDGKPLPFRTAVVSGRATGVPGAVAMLARAQRDHGALPWSSLFGDAERLAADGFTVSPRLAAELRFPSAESTQPDVVAYFTKPDGTKVAAGDVLRNPAYAAMLRRLAAGGPAALYRGQVAREIVDRIHAEPLPSPMTTADLAAYEPRVTPALCRPYRNWRVCTAPDPAGGSALLEGLGILERTDIASRGPTDPQAWFELAQAERLMYADRDLYDGDPAFVRVPVDGLLSPAYLASRAALIGTEAGAPPAPGVPPGAPREAVAQAYEPGGTSHFVIVDTHGDVLSMTTTVESLFGTGRMVEGFFLNNQLTDFSFAPTSPDGAPLANAVAPDKRPRSAMAPVIVTDRDGRFVATLGSPGGPAILAYDLKALVGVLDWRLPMQEALALPNLVARGASFNAEADKFAPGVVDGLAQRGVHLTKGFGENSGLHGIEVSHGALEGGADPRREGVARGF